ncbi:MAG: hypothetical protein K5663_06880 [Clostridiales bacterium]|nr:hypothetical protein [Clostridiales bacterium]
MNKRILSLLLALVMALGSLCAFASTDKLEDALAQLNFYLTYFNTEEYKNEVDLSEIADAFASLGNSGIGFYVYANVLLLLEKGDYRTAAIVKMMLESNEELSKRLDDEKFRETYPSISSVSVLLSYVDGRIAENGGDSETAKQCYLSSGGFFDSYERLLALSGGKSEEMYKRAFNHFTKGEYEEAYKLFYELAESNYTDSATFRDTCAKILAGMGIDPDTVISGAWSEWTDKLPDGIDGNKYEIETMQLYRSRVKETRTDKQKDLKGWTLTGSSEQTGGFGEWSKWSAKEVKKSNTRQVETQQMYRYRNLEKTTSTKSSIKGWTKYDSKTTYSAWGAWSKWSTTKVTKSATREVKTKTQYSTRDLIDFADSSSNNDSNLLNNGYERDGWGTYADGTIYYGYVKLTDWSSWSDTKQTSFMRIRTRTVYQYRDRKATTTYYFKRWGAWSEWTASKVAANDSRQVQNAVWYRYRDKLKETVYYYERWSNWSGWSENAVNSNANTQVEKKTRYRYRAK